MYCSSLVFPFTTFFIYSFLLLSSFIRSNNSRSVSFRSLHFSKCFNVFLSLQCILHSCFYIFQRIFIFICFTFTPEFCDYVFFCLFLDIFLFYLFMFSLLNLCSLKYCFLFLPTNIIFSYLLLPTLFSLYAFFSLLFLPQSVSAKSFYYVFVLHLVPYTSVFANFLKNFLVVFFFSLNNAVIFLLNLTILVYFSFVRFV